MSGSELSCDSAWYPFFCDCLRHGRPFAFSRWGDGEFKCLLKHRGQNCDGHEYDPLLGDKLADVLRSRPDYFLGLQPKAMNDMGDAVNAWIEENRVGGLPWINADIFHNASQSEKLQGFFDAIRGRQVIVVGPYWMRWMPSSLMSFSLEQIPEQNCWKEYASILERIESRIFGGLVLVFCAGMTSNVLIDDLHIRHGDSVTLIDMGSALDWYCGVKTRKYMKVMK